MMIRFEGVTFIKAECLKMTKKEFIDYHVDVFWTDRDKATRRKMLSQAYDLMAPKKDE